MSPAVIDQLDKGKVCFVKYLIIFGPGDNLIMCKKGWILWLVLLMDSGSNLFSQQLSHQVIVPAASIISESSVNYSQTIGETAVEIIHSSDYILTQGFQQPSIKPASDDQPEGNGVDVYPNPVINDLKIKLFGDDSREFRIDIINVSGMTVITEKISFNNEFNFEKIIPVEKIYKGLYFIRIISSDHLINRTFKITKM